MPSTTEKQRKFMRAAAHNSKFAKKAGIKQSVAKDFYAADKRAGYAFGGGVLGRLAGRIAQPERIPDPGMRPLPDVMRGSDRAMGRARQLRMRFKGGRSM